MKQHFCKKTSLLIVITALLISPAAQAQEGSNVIALTITDDRQAVQPGTEITYQIVARNNSASEIKTGKLVMNIPD